MQEISTKASQAFSFMEREQFDDKDVMDVKNRLPATMNGENVRKVHFYRLWCRGRWVNTHNRIWLTDHTDRFYEVCDKLAEFLVESMNYCHVDPTSVDKKIFITDANNIIGIKTKFRCYQDLVNLFSMYLPPNDYWFGIDEFDVDY